MLQCGEVSQLRRNGACKHDSKHDSQRVAAETVLPASDVSPAFIILHCCWGLRSRPSHPQLTAQHVAPKIEVLQCGEVLQLRWDGTCERESANMISAREVDNHFFFSSKTAILLKGGRSINYGSSTYRRASLVHPYVGSMSISTVSPRWELSSS